VRLRGALGHFGARPAIVQPTRRTQGIRGEWDACRAFGAADYYRYDPEQTPSGNQISPVSKLLFRESGDAHPANDNKGFLIDRFLLESDF
jgi:hypothetical protein